VGPVKPHRGVTLLELLVAIGLATVVTGFAWAVWLQSARQNTNRLKESDDLRDRWLEERSRWRFQHPTPGISLRGGDSSLFDGAQPPGPGQDPEVGP
jgi:prepilin-type N-terminal cleavage/methylation domain-containing protein